MRGNISNTEYATLSRMYTFAALRDVLPGRITPTDVDNSPGTYLIENKGHFLWFEFKTEGAAIPRGQAIALERLVTRGAPSDTLLVAYHPVIKTVNVPPDIRGLEVWKWDRPIEQQRGQAIPGRLYKSGIRDGGELRHWVDHWFKHIHRTPNSFVTNFRKANGSYPGDVQWSTL